jgi:hypothetical protein
MGLLGMDTSGFTGGMFALLGSLFFWLIMALIFVLVAFGFLLIRKKKKLSVSIIEITPLGRGKVGLKSGRKLKGGWFKHKTAFFGLWDYGYEEVFKTKDNRQVLSISSEDYHEINGKMGLICMRSPEDPRILVPVNKMEMKNGELLNEIAPADYRSVVVDIIKKAEKETSDRTDKIMQWVFWGGIIIFSFIAIAMIVNMVKSGQTEAKDLILEAGNLRQDQLKTICQGLAHAGESVATSTAP